MENGFQVGISADSSQVDVLELLTSGEELLASTMRGVNEILALGRLTAFPADKHQLQVLSQRLATVPETLRGLTGVLGRLRITVDLLNAVVAEECASEVSSAVGKPDNKEVIAKLQRYAS